jgi:hypothetical protein
MLGFLTVLSFVLASLGSGVSMIIGPIAFVILVIMLIQEKRRRGKVWWRSRKLALWWPLFQRSETVSSKSRQCWQPSLSACFWTNPSSLSKSFITSSLVIMFNRFRTFPFSMSFIVYYSAMRLDKSPRILIWFYQLCLYCIYD